MDALEDYVCPLATSELILLPVTGLECVGDRLLAGERSSCLPKCWVYRREPLIFSTKDFLRFKLQDCVS
uniref:WD repeat domain 6 n=1 Tax=Cercocebus atys TaxID=9531 RepID=A0A2K5LF42_CERAT